ncbi:MAG: hypothetical protein ACKODH_07450 [Limisphaerales bacterium]
MDEIDFSTALARLLSDTGLRERFARDSAAVAAQLRVQPPDRDAFVALSTTELETQARILLRKRFKAVSYLIPATMDRLGPTAWTCFLEHARCCWPQGANMEVEDTRQFCAHLAVKQPAALCQSELNRLRFHLSSQRWAVRWVRDLRVRGQLRRAFQVFVRQGRGWSEHSVFWSLG